MTSWATHLARADRRWAFIVRIEGVGPHLSTSELSAAGSDARTRFVVEATIV